MHKIWIILSREYLTKVMNRRFLLTTLLTPVSLIVMVIVVSLIFSYQGNQEKSILILDEQDILDGRIKDQSNFYFSFAHEPLEKLLGIPEEDRSWDGLLYLTSIDLVSSEKYSVRYYAEKPLDFQNSESLENILRKKIRDYKLRKNNITEDLAASLESDISIVSTPLDPDAEEKGFLQGSISLVFGSVVGYLLMLMILINGTAVFHSVMEEKTNRIVEVMISTVKPFELMLGKIGAATLVGFTQFLIWGISIPLAFFLLMLVFPVDMSDMSSSADMMSTMDQGVVQELMYDILLEVEKINWTKSIIILVLFFMAGYFLYATIFAALGALAGDDPQQANTLTIPVTLLIVCAMYLSVPVMGSPDSALAKWASMVPFFSPILMPGLSVMDISIVRCAISFVILVASCIGITWLAARIYRTGILMYGKKVGIRDVWNNFF